MAWTIIFEIAMITADPMKEMFEKAKVEPPNVESGVGTIEGGT